MQTQNTAPWWMTQPGHLPDSAQASSGRARLSGRIRATGIPTGKRPIAHTEAFAERIAWIIGFVMLIVLMIRMPVLIFVAWILLGIRLMFVKWITGSYGTARWAEREDMRTAGLLNDDGLILCRASRERPRFLKALKHLFSAPWHDSLRTCKDMRAAFIGSAISGTPLLRLPTYCHAAAVSPPGGGKTTGIVVPNLITYSRGSVIVLDPKGELYSLTASVRQQYWHNKVICLDPFHILGLSSDSLNPLDMLQTTDPMIVSAALSD